MNAGLEKRPFQNFRCSSILNCFCFVLGATLGNDAKTERERHGAKATRMSDKLPVIHFSISRHENYCHL